MCLLAHFHSIFSFIITQSRQYLQKHFRKFPMCCLALHHNKIYLEYILIRQCLNTTGNTPKLSQSILVGLAEVLKIFMWQNSIQTCTILPIKRLGCIHFTFIQLQIPTGKKNSGGGFNVWKKFGAHSHF